MSRSKLVALAVLTIAGAISVAAAADKKYGPGVSDSEIKLGNIVPYSGPASSYGQAGRAIGAYFDKVNAEGGVNGRKLKLISLDDGYSPSKSIEQARRLVEQEEVLAVVGNLGSSTNSANYRYFNQRKVPDLFLITGLARWNNPKETPWVMGFIPTYVSEGTIAARYVLSTVKEPRVAILYQNDDSGKELMEGFRKGLGVAADKLIVATASYELSDPTVDSQVLTLAASRANVYMEFGSPKAVAQSIRKAYDIDWKPVRYVSSPAANVAATFVPAGLDKSTGIVSSAYVKDPTDNRWADDKGYKEWLAWMKKYLPDGSPGDYLNVMAYSIAQATVDILKRCGDDLSRENVLRQASTIKNLELPMLLPGAKINTTPSNYGVITQMQMQRFNGKEWVLFGPLLRGD